MMLHAFYGDGATPRIVIDGSLAHAASVPKIEDLAKWLKN